MPEVPPPGPDELPPGLRKEYLAGMRATLGVLAGIAKRLATAGSDREALETLRRETHKIHGSAGSFGFMEASRLAAGMEATAKDWIARPGDTDMDRGGLAGWFVTRLAEMLKLTVPASAAAPPAAASGSPPRLIIRRPPPRAAQKAVPEPPTQASVAPPKARPPRPPAPLKKPALTAPELIVVEDDPALAELLEYGLRARGYRFVSYRNGRDALRELLALDVAGTRPVVLLDVDLPGLDGYSVLEGLERDRPGVYRVVFTTVHGGEAEQLRGLEAGALDYLVKPISLRVALEKIRRWVGR